MTAQILNTFIFKDDEYGLIGLNGDKLIHPSQFGMDPVMLHTACYDGFYATYELTDSSLILRKMTLREQQNNYLAIEGNKPIIKDEIATYHDMSIVVPFTGKIRIAKDFIEALYVHMGYQKATAFETILDISLTKGKVLTINDRSEEVAEKRGQFKNYYESECSKKVIEDAFSLDFKLM